LRKLVLVKIGAEALQKSQPNNPPTLAK